MQKLVRKRVPWTNQDDYLKNLAKKCEQRDLANMAEKKSLKCIIVHQQHTWIADKQTGANKPQVESQNHFAEKSWTKGDDG